MSLSRRNFMIGAGLGALPALGAAGGVDRNAAAMMSDGIFNVRDYGAKGDDATGDSEAIQRAIDAAAQVGGTVFFPPGVYRCHDVRVRPHVALRANAVWSYQTVLAGAVLRIDSPDAHCLLDLDGAYGAHLTGLHLVGDQKYEKKVIGIRGRSGRIGTLDEEDSMIIDDCKVELFSGDAIVMEGVEAFWLRHSMIYHNYGNGLTSVGACDWFILDNVFNGNWGHGVWGTDTAAAAVMFVENRIEWNHRHGVLLTNSDLWSIVGNSFDQNAHAGLCLDRAITTSVTGNVFRYNCRRQKAELPEYQDVPDDQKGAAIVANDCIGTVISANTVRGWRAPEENCADYGLRCRALESCIIKDNVFDRAYKKSLLLDEGGHKSAVVIKDNVGTVNPVAPNDARPRVLKSYRDV